MAIISGYKNLQIVSSIEKDKDILIDIKGIGLYQCKEVTYNSKTDCWEIKGGKELETEEGNIKALCNSIGVLYWL